MFLCGANYYCNAAQLINDKALKPLCAILKSAITSLFSSLLSEKCAVLKPSGFPAPLLVTQCNRS